MASFTFWKSRYAISGDNITLPWSEWSTLFLEHDSTDLPKASLPGLVLGRMKDGGRRKNTNVQTIEALALDIEDKNNNKNYFDDLEYMLHKIQHLEYVAYTTYSHTATKPRIRVILPLADELPADSYKEAMSYINNLTGSIADLGAQKLSQPVYLPAHKNGADHWATRNEGDHLLIDPEVHGLRMALGEGSGRAPFDAHTRQACKAVLLGRPYAEDGNRDETATRIAWHLAKTIKDPSYQAVEEVFHWSTRAMGPDAPDAQNILNKMTSAEIKHQEEDEETGETAIIQHKSTYYMRMRGGGFSRPYVKEEFRAAANKHLRQLDGVHLTYANEKGAIKRKNLEAMMDQYGDLAQAATIDLCLHKGTFEHETINEATVLWPELDPVFDEEIDEWLGLLGGEKLKDWLSILADLDRLSSALVMVGPRGIGKTLLAMGCASRFGSSAPAKQAALTGHFQGDLARCPLVYIDEDVQDNPYDRNFMSTIRSELSIKERSINRKFLPHVQMNGAIRCIISANHLPFHQKGSQTDKDLAAIAERFYWIDCGKEPAAYLQTVGADSLAYWRKVAIAQHIRHLEETREVSKDARFGVSGDSEELADLINITSDWNSWVAEWVCNGVIDDFKKLKVGDKDVRNGAVIFNKEVYVRVKTIVKTWDRYLENNRTAPDTRHISEAVQGISEPDKRYLPRDIGIENGNNQQRYYHIRRGPLLKMVVRNGGSIEELTNAL